MSVSPQRLCAALPAALRRFGFSSVADGAVTMTQLETVNAPPSPAPTPRPSAAPTPWSADALVAGGRGGEFGVTNRQAGIGAVEQDTAPRAAYTLSVVAAPTPAPSRAPAGPLLSADELVALKALAFAVAFAGGIAGTVRAARALGLVEGGSGAVAPHAGEGLALQTPAQRAAERASAAQRKWQQGAFAGGGSTVLDQYARGSDGDLGSRHGARLYQTVASVAADAEDDVL